MLPIMAGYLRPGYIKQRSLTWRCEYLATVLYFVIDTLLPQCEVTSRAKVSISLHIL